MYSFLNLITELRLILLMPRYCDLMDSLKKRVYRMVREVVSHGKTDYYWADGLNEFVFGRD